MQQWWWALLPVAIGGLGYLAKRYVEGAASAEAVRRRLEVLKLLRGLRREGATMADLDRIERDARGD